MGPDTAIRKGPLLGGARRGSDGRVKGIVQEVDLPGDAYLCNLVVALEPMAVRRVGHARAKAAFKSPGLDNGHQTPESRPPSHPRGPARTGHAHPTSLLPPLGPAHLVSRHRPRAGS